MKTNTVIIKLPKYKYINTGDMISILGNFNATIEDDNIVLRSIQKESRITNIGNYKLKLLTQPSTDTFKKERIQQYNIAKDYASKMVNVYNKKINEISNS